MDGAIFAVVASVLAPDHLLVPDQGSLWLSDNDGGDSHASLKSAWRERGLGERGPLVYGAHATWEGAMHCATGAKGKLEDRAMERDLRKGSTTVLILNVLVEKPMYGYQISKELKRRSNGYFSFKEGTLYPALHRMEKDGLLTSEWQVVEKGPSRKYYYITEEGRKVLADSAREWTTFSQQLLGILGERGTEPASG